jgi:hypothetical protein
MLYGTRFFVNWPEHLGGGSINIDLAGTMVLIPLLAVG